MLLQLQLCNYNCNMLINIFNTLYFSNTTIYKNNKIL